jgi:hypothetical protein
VEWIEVRDGKGEVVWKSAEVELLAIDCVESTIKVLDLNTSLMMGVHIVRDGEHVVRMPAGTPVKV